MQIARIRALDAKVGDVVSRDPDSSRGWFQLHQIDHLHDGKVNLSDGGVNNSFAIFPLEVVGLQLAKMVSVEEQPELPNFSAAEVDEPATPDDEDELDEDHLEPVQANSVN